MNSVWRSLLWKEWREHRWTLAGLTAIAVLAPMLMSLGSPGMFMTAMISTFFFGVPLGSMFVGMHAAAGENSQGTIRFLQALPTPLPKPATAKLFWAAITVVAPTLIAVLAAAAWNAAFVRQANAVDVQMAQQFSGAWGISHWHLSMAVAGAAGALSILLWMAAAGVNRRDEVRAAAVGLLAILITWLAYAGAYGEFSKVQHGNWIPPNWLRVAWAAAPGGPAIGRAPEPPAAVAAPSQSWFGNYLLPLAVAVAVHSGLAAWYIGRFGRVAPRREATPAPELYATRVSEAPLSAPRRTPLAALVWKQCRESAPLAGLGCGLIALAAAWAVVASRSSPGIADNVVGFALSVWLFVGAFVSVVAGVGAFMEDLRPGLHTFWRSRPINVNAWFAVKTALTLLLIMTVLAIPPASLLAFYSRLVGEGIKRMAADMIPAGLMAQVGLFSVAAAMATLVRQPIYAAILAIAIFVGYLVGVDWVVTHTTQFWSPRTHPISAAVVFITPTAAALFFTWLAVRNNWGWKG